MNYKIENGNITVRLADYIKMLEINLEMAIKFQKDKRLSFNLMLDIVELEKELNLLKEQL